MREIVKNLSTTADKIRALDEAGFERADIARFLDKRYQHVRNVLVAPHPARNKAAKADFSPRDENSVAEGESRRAARLKAKVQIGAGGRVVIPADMRAAMGVAEGDTLVARVVDGEFRLMSRDVAVRLAQNLVRQFVPAGVSLVDQLVEERRSEARREASE
jgi:AbrB family looped-hinge helix DNA binding protein